MTNAHFLSFMEASQRIAARDYQPTDHDVVRARLRTLDIQEHELYIDESRVLSIFYFRHQKLASRW